MCKYVRFWHVEMGMFCAHLVEIGHQKDQIWYPGCGDSACGPPACLYLFYQKWAKFLLCYEVCACVDLWSLLDVHVCANVHMLKYGVSWFTTGCEKWTSKCLYAHVVWHVVTYGASVETLLDVHMWWRELCCPDRSRAAQGGVVKSDLWSHTVYNPVHWGPNVHKYEVGAGSCTVKMHSTIWCTICDLYWMCHMCGVNSVARTDPGRRRVGLWNLTSVETLLGTTCCMLPGPTYACAS